MATKTRKVTIIKYLFDGSETPNFSDTDNLIPSSTEGRKIYIDFDDVYIYFGYTGEEMNKVNKTFYFALTTEENKTKGSRELPAEAWYEGSKVTLPIKVNHLYTSKYYKNASNQEMTIKTKRTYGEDAWNERIEGSQILPDEFKYHTATSKDDICVYAISREALGNPSSTIHFVVYVKTLKTHKRLSPA